MFKNIISPVQAWLLSQERCVGCGTPLKKGKKTIKMNIDIEVICNKCGRIFILDSKTGHFRRAPIKSSS